MAVEYRTGDIFSYHPKKRIIAHSCNCCGQWGAGIALEFANRFPNAHIRYQTLCKIYKNKMLGQGIVIEDDSVYIGCLFTSFGYGKKKDSQIKILENTKKAVEDLITMAQVSIPRDIEIHSPKVNAGLFGVPWKFTESIINECLQKYPEIKWIVWEL
jgi:ADP-ribose 1''-phosphate phosphatase